MRSLIIALALVSASPAAAAEVTAMRLDGSTVVGELTSWDGQALEMSGKDGPVHLSAADLLSIRWLPLASAVVAEKSPRLPAVELVDGSVLPIEEFGRRGNTTQVSLRGGMPGGAKKIRLPDRLVAAVRLQPLVDVAAKQWDEIRNQEFPSDVLVLAKRGGQSLDYVEGTIGEVTAERVDFKLDDVMKPVKRSDVAGVIFYRANRPPPTEPFCVLDGRDGLRAFVKTVTLRDGVAHLVTEGGAKIDWPMEGVQSADFSAGKVVFLSDLEPAVETWKSLVSMPASATLAVAYGKPRRDQSAFGGPLTLWFPGGDTLAPVGHTKTFGRGLAVRSRTVLEYRVPRGFTRLLAVAGIEPATRASGAARLSISGDERSLLDVELTGDKSPLDVELDMTGVKRLKIVVDYGKNLDTGDWVNLGDLRVVK